MGKLSREERQELARKGAKARWERVRSKQLDTSAGNPDAREEDGLRNSLPETEGSYMCHVILAVLGLFGFARDLWTCQKRVFSDCGDCSIPAQFNSYPHTQFTYLPHCNCYQEIGPYEGDHIERIAGYYWPGYFKG